MRREEIDRIPGSIPWSRLQEVITGLGIVPRDVMAVHIYPRSIDVEILATDAKGHRFRAEDGDAAKHSISIKIEYEQ